MSSEKTEQATPKRLRSARSRGDVPVSAAVTQLASMFGAVLMLPAAARALVEGFNHLLHEAVANTALSAWEVSALLLWSSTPLLGVCTLLALTLGLVQTGGVFAPSKLTPKLENLDPIAGLGRLFTWERVFQAVRALLGAALVGWLCWITLRAHAESVVSTLGSLPAAAALAESLGMRLLWTALGVSAALATIDWLLTRRSWLERHKMTKSEVQREYRESEGDPTIKQSRQRAHQELLENASLFGVKDASVLIINPTHFATALRYDKERDQAPTVVAQGRGELARRLIDAARAYNVPVVRDVPVARALAQLQLGDEIPEELYEAVAEILRELWQASEGDRDELA